MDCGDGQLPARTHPIGPAQSLEVNAVALGRRQGSIPVTVIGLVVPYGEGLHHRQVNWGELCREVVRRVQDGGVPEANRDGKTLDDVGRPPHLLLTLLLDHHLVRTGERTQRSGYKNLKMKEHRQNIWERSNLLSAVLTYTYTILIH